MVTARLRDAHARKPSKRKLPAVHSMIRRSWHMSTEGLPQLMEAAAATLAFFLMLRSCEYSSKSSSTFDPKYQSVRKDVEFVSYSDAPFSFNSILDARRHPVHGYVFKLADGNYHPASAFLQYAKITIHGSKAGGSSDWTRSVSPSGHELCALSILLFFMWQTRTVPPSSPLFSLPSGEILTYASMLAHVKRTAADVGLPPSDYGTHSYRSGGCSHLLSAGVPTDVIRILGRWSSDAFFLYAVPSIQMFAGLSEAVARPVNMTFLSRI